MEDPSLFFANLDENLVFLARVLKDAEPDGFVADMIYLFAQTLDNEDSPLEAGAELWHRGHSTRIGICDGDTGHGYPGFAKWYDRLRGLGVPGDCIIPVQISAGESVNTRTEAIAFIWKMKANGWRRAFISAAPFHQLRAFLTVVRRALLVYPEVLLYNKPGKELRWDEYVRHSQGKTMGTREGIFLAGELGRIRTYFGKGHVASFQEASSYMHGRDLAR